ncbi:MAG: glycosyltransferase [Verrucomicrobiia bacterium]|jgi:cellulose synthase/poly-beta-1,6-N-acetylglucosamine synthase-like glycosyltransferase
MSLFLFWLAVATLLLVLATTIEFALGNRSLSRLGNLPPFTGSPSPKVSVIIAARNEARNIEQGLPSVLVQDYPNIEFIAVDDRSTERWHCVGAPVTALLFQYIIWRATLKTLRNDGIDWRGTHYSLQELKANKV